MRKLFCEKANRCFNWSMIRFINTSPSSIVMFGFQYRSSTAGAIYLRERTEIGTTLNKPMNGAPAIALCSVFDLVARGEIVQIVERSLALVVHAPQQQIHSVRLARPQRISQLAANPRGRRNHAQLLSGTILVQMHILNKRRRRKKKLENKHNK